MYERYDRSDQVVVGEIAKWGRKPPRPMQPGVPYQSPRQVRRADRAARRAAKEPWFSRQVGARQGIEALQQKPVLVEHIGMPSASEMEGVVARAIGRKAKIAAGGVGALGLGFAAHRAAMDQRRTRAWEQMSRNTGYPHGPMARAQIGKRERSVAREAAGVAGSGALAWGFARSPMVRRALLRGAESASGSEAAAYKALLEAQEALKGPTASFARGMKNFGPVRGGLKVIPRRARPGIALTGGSLLATGGTGMMPGATVTGA